MVAMRDVAEYAIAALDHKEAERRTLLIGGPQPLSWRDVVTVFEQELGRPIPVRTVPPGQPIPGMPPMITELLTALETYDSPLDTTALATTYRITPTRLVDFVHGFIQTSRHHVN